MKAILGTLEHYCTDRVCQGEVIETVAANTFVRRYVLKTLEGKSIYTPFPSKEAALDWAKRAGIEVLE